MRLRRWVYGMAFAVSGGLNALASEGVAPLTNDDIVKLVGAEVACTIIVTFYVHTHTH